MLYREEPESQLIEKNVESLEKLYGMYNDYAFIHGFGIRKANLHRSSKDNRITSMKYSCCNEGKKEEPKELEKEKYEDKEKPQQMYKKHETRTGCKAHIFVKPSENGGWIVTRHEMEHNHEFFSLEETSMLRSHRYIPKACIAELERMLKLGIKITDAYNCIKLQLEGSAIIGFTEKDAYNTLAKIKKDSWFFDGDAQELINKFVQIKKRDPDFYYDYKVDEEQHLESIFWRDRRMKEDYKAFGDLVVFDTTFKTDKYGLSCAPFISMNHHRRNLLVGCGFVRSETISSFIWLFNTFKASMDNVEPQTIMTYQDAAMDNAILQCFHTSSHRLCTWHIGKNSKNHMSTYYMKAGFSDLFDHVLRRCESETEFYSACNRLDEKYEVRKNTWFNDLFDKRRKWSNALEKDNFSGGPISSQRSESLNNCISKRKRATMCLMDCYHMFCEIIKKWRGKEKKDKGDNKVGFPDVTSPDCQILQNAKRVYTIRAYQMFEEEYSKSHGCRQELQHYVVEPNGWKTYTYQVYQKRHAEIREVSFVVKYGDGDNSVMCECRKIIYCGYLCCHALRVMQIHLVIEIPRQYYLKRWTREARPERVQSAEEKVDERNRSLSQNWRIQLLRKFDSMFLESETNDIARKICDQGFVNTRHDLELEIGTIDVEKYYEDERSCVHTNSILDPITKRKKGEITECSKSTTEKIANQKKKGKKYTPKKKNQSNCISTEGVQTTPVYIPQFHASQNTPVYEGQFDPSLSNSSDSMQSSEFEAQPSSSIIGENNGNIRSMHGLIFGTQGINTSNPMET